MAWEQVRRGSDELNMNGQALSPDILRFVLCKAVLESYCIVRAISSPQMRSEMENSMPAISTRMLDKDGKTVWLAGFIHDVSRECPRDEIWFVNSDGGVVFRLFNVGTELPRSTEE